MTFSDMLARLGSRGREAFVDPDQIAAVRSMDFFNPGDCEIVLKNGVRFVVQGDPTEIVLELARAFEGRKKAV